MPVEVPFSTPQDGERCSRMHCGMRIPIPATALAQAIRNPARQARLSRLIRQAVVTGDAADLRRIAPRLRLVVV